jgi:hypothetical protein
LNKSITEEAVTISVIGFVEKVLKNFHPEFSQEMSMLKLSVELGCPVQFLKAIEVMFWW